LSVLTPAEAIRQRRPTPLGSRHFPPLSTDKIKQIQRVVGSILYYACAVDLTVFAALSTIASEQSKGTQQTMQKCKQLLDYLATHPDATVRFHASDMILNIHSNASYPSELKAHSRVCGHFFMGWKPDATKPIKLNGAFFTLCAVVPSFSTSNRPQFFASHSKNLAICNPQYQ
jgi:hypothetical protein